MAETITYSVDAVIEALTRSGAACAHATDDHEIIRETLLAVMELLQAKCGIFYPAADSVLAGPNGDESVPIRIHSAATGEPHMPTQLPPDMEVFIFESLQQVATSQDPAFARQFLKKFPSATASSSSVWAGVSAGETRFGIIALFDPETRNFSPLEHKLVRTFSLQMGHGLATVLAQKLHSAAPGKAAVDEGFVDRYIEFARIMSGVSRELINPLTAVLGYIELLKGEPQSERSAHYLAKLQEQTEKTQSVLAALNTTPQAQGWRPAPSAAAEAALPLAVPAAKPDAMEAAAPEPHSRILLVQKNEAVMEFQKSVLATVGAEAICTVAGWEALSILQNSKVDAVILDDELDGEWPASKIFTWICEHKPELAQKVLLTISPKPSDETREWVEGCGIVHVTKPLHIVKLFAGIQRILGLTTALQTSKMLH